MLSQERLKELLSYDPETGLFTWLVSPTNVVKVGQVAGTENIYGYIQISINKVSYKAHRLVWLYIYGSFPNNNIDHINGIRNDNRIVNLRQATTAENGANTGMYITNTSGYKGVTWDKHNKKWKASCGAGGNHKHLGLFSSKAAAHEAYQEFAKQHHKEFYSNRS